jgi:hypothetical protein
MGRPPKLTPHQQREAIKRFDQGKEITCRERAQLQRKRGDDFKVVRATMSRDFQIVQLNINEEALKKADPRIRNQLVGCMYAHNELTVLNRILLFSMNVTGDGELYDSAQSVQMWCLLQVLAAKLVETWTMLNDRFLKAEPKDPALVCLTEQSKASLDWLKDYFGVARPLKDNALKTIRDKTAFHYDKLNLEAAVDNLATGESAVYLAQHPANGLYYLGSALVFRTVFATIADKVSGPAGESHGERTVRGFGTAVEDAKLANFHMHVLLYGLIDPLLEQVLGCPLDTLDQVRINVSDAPDPAKVGLPAFIDIGAPPMRDDE